MKRCNKCHECSYCKYQTVVLNIVYVVAKCDFLHITIDPFLLPNSELPDNIICRKFR